MLAKGVLVALVSMASVDAAQGGLIFGRRNRGNDCCCEGGYGSGGGYGRSGYRMNGYGYSGSMYSDGYAYSGPVYNGTMYGGSTYSGNMYGPTSGGYAMGNATSGYADANLGIVHFEIAGGDTVGANKGRLRINMPSNDARLWINNQQAQFSGTDRVIDVTLNPSQATKYTLTAQWVKDGREVVRKKEVELLPGQETKIAFSDMDAGSTASPTNPPINPNG
jgi:hypothetical protein